MPCPPRGCRSSWPETQWMASSISRPPELSCNDGLRNAVQDVVMSVRDAIVETAGSTLCWIWRLACRGRF